MSLSLGQLMEYAEKQALAAVVLKTQSPTAGSVYLALVTAAPAAGTDLTMAAYSGTEFSTSDGYARQTIAFGTPTSASPSVISNSGTITFGPITTGAPGTATWGIVSDASSGTTANVIAAMPLANSRTPLVGDSLTAAAATFTIQV